MPVTLELEPELREEIGRVLCRWMSMAVEGATERDAQATGWRDQMEGLSQPVINSRWAGACDLDDPITLEAFLSLLAAIMQSLRHDPWVAVQGYSPDDEENATAIEQWLSTKFNELKLVDKLYDAAYNALSAPCAPMYCGWKTSSRRIRSTGYVSPGSNRVFAENEKEDGQYYEEVNTSRDEVTYDGFDIRAPDLRDVYVYPPTARSVTDAIAVGERFQATIYDLMDGVEDFGYDPDVVDELVRMGPGGYRPDEQDGRASSDEQDGLDGNAVDFHDGYYDLYLMYTRLPWIWDGADGDNLVPEELRQDEFQVVICPTANVVLKIEFCPYPERPYWAGHMLPKPGRMMGHCVPSMLEALQTEANANLRFTIDGLNLTMAPVLLAQKTIASDLKKRSIFPGAILAVDDINQVRPLEWDRSAGRDGLAYAQFLKSRAKDLIAAEGQGQLATKVRKAAEIDNIQQATAAKYGLFLMSFQHSIVEELARRMVSLAMDHMGDDGEEFMFEGKNKRITPSQLRGQYRFVATATSATASPDQRVANTEHKLQVQGSYLKAKTEIQDPTVHPLLWHGARQALLELGDTNPEGWIGPEPTPPAPQQGMGPMGPMGPMSPGASPMSNGAMSNGAMTGRQ